jgi:hypothetical protein
VEGAADRQPILRCGNHCQLPPPIGRGVASREFSRSDFPAAGVRVHRIARPIIAELLKRCLMPDRDILEAATWLRDLVMAHGIVATPSGKQGRPPDHRVRTDLRSLFRPPPLPQLTGVFDNDVHKITSSPQ